MGSLRERAQSFFDDFQKRRSQLKLLRQGEPGVEDDQEISAEDRAKILGQIDEVVSRSRIAITPDTFRVTPKRQGWLFPTLVNVLAIAAVAVGIYLAVTLGNRAEQTLTTASAGLTTAEGLLLETFRQESRQELESKDREIADIRGRLEGIDQETERIRQTVEAQAASREQELRQELAASLEAERARLARSGLGEADIADQVAALERANAQSLETRLAALRDQAQAEREEQERTLTRLKAEFEQSLQAAQGERTRLAQESAEKQAEMEAGARQRQLALEQENSQALAELAQLRRQQENEQLVLDQFLTFYRRAREAIQAREGARARSVLADFRKYLDEPTVSGLKAVSDRRQVELFLIGSLEEALNRSEQEAQTQQTTQTLVASANLVTAVAELVQRGDALYQQRDYAQARDLYLLALARIPAVQAGRARLEEIDRLFQDQDRVELTALMRTANDAYRAGDYDRAVSAYTEALVRMQGERGTVDTLVAQLTEIGARTRESEIGPRLLTLEQEVAAANATIQGLESRLSTTATELARAGTDLRSAQTRVAASEADNQRLLQRVNQLSSRQEAVTALRSAAAGAVAPQAEASREELLDLLQTRLRVQRVLLSDEVLSQYTDLYENHEKYLQALVAERAAEARIETLRDLDAVLARLTGAASPSGSAGLGAFSAAEENELLLGILDKLGALLR